MTGWVITDIDVIMQMMHCYDALYTRAVTHRATLDQILELHLPESYVLRYLADYKVPKAHCDTLGRTAMKMYPTPAMAISLVTCKIRLSGDDATMLAKILPQILDDIMASPKIAAQFLTQYELLSKLEMAMCHRLCHVALTRPITSTRRYGVMYYTPEYFKAAGCSTKGTDAYEVFNTHRNYGLFTHIIETVPLPVNERMVKQLHANGVIPAMQRIIRLAPAQRDKVIIANIRYFTDEHFAAFPICAKLATKIIKLSNGVYGYPRVVAKLHAIIREDKRKL